MKPPRRAASSARWQVLLAVLVAVCLAAGASSQLNFANFWAPKLDGGSPPLAQLLFNCPDGRLGLHVVHTRFLITQAAANRVFVASRLQLMRTFFVPSLNAQTSQAFVVAAGYDPGLNNSVLAALDDTLGLMRVASLAAPETKVYPAVTHHSLAAKLERLDPRVHDVDLFITSRMDLDDAVHVGAVEGVQQYACSVGGRGNGSTNTDPVAAVRLVYMHKGALWHPSLDHPYGVTCEWTNGFVSHLAILQSMVLSGKAFLRACPLNVYSYPHYKPAALEKALRTTAGCRCSFKWESDVAQWEPPAQEDLAWLYVKTAASWTFGKKDQRPSTHEAALGIDALARSFALDKAALASANLLFLGLEAEGSAAMQGSTALELER
jgi:hypothetical protein